MRGCKVQIPNLRTLGPFYNASVHLSVGGTFSFCKNSNLPSIHNDMLACLCNFCVYFCVKSSDKLLIYLMLDPAIIEVKMETLKTHEFRPWLNFITLSCVRREDGRHTRDQC